MSVRVEDRTAATAGTSALIAWLAQLGEQHNLAIPAPEVSPRATAICTLLDTLSQEITAYRSVVKSARVAARRNTEELAAVVRSTQDQQSVVRTTAVAATAAGTGADLMATAAQSLLGFAQAAASAAKDAGSGVTLIDAALRDVASRLTESRSPLSNMRGSTDGVATFLMTLARLSRHAQLLAVNASIEAAHLAEAGSGFGIVAEEVRKLSISTRESKRDVSHIVAELRESTAEVAVATDDSTDATAAAAHEIQGANEALSRTGRGIEDFEQMVVTVADVGATQSMALQTVSASVNQIAHHADEAVRASRDAEQLDLDTLLARAETRLARWTIRANGGGGGQLETDAFCSWIGSIIAGADAETAAEIDSHPDQRAVVLAVRKMLKNVHADQRAILADMVAVAVAVSRNGYSWRSIAQSLDNVTDEIHTMREMIDESTRGAAQSAALAAGMHTLAETIRGQYDRALQLLQGALARISRITDSVHEIDGFVESMNAAAARADHIMALIETISSETDLLSLNAAIEAAHAGEQGRGFSVIAEEIGALARSTNESTISVSELVSRITQISGSLQTSVAAAATSTHEITSSAERVRGAIALLREAFEGAMRHAAEVSAAASDQTRVLDHVVENVDRSALEGERTKASATQAGRLELALLGSRAHAIAGQRTIGTVIEGVRAFGETLCIALEAVYAAALAANRVTLNALFDFTYEPIVGPNIQTLARLFDVGRVPAQGFAPVKYATPWDASVDQALNGALESAYDGAAAFAPVTIFISDLNGFFYAYPRRKIAGWTNDAAVDNLGNRIKRMFEDDYSLSVVRSGLGPTAAGLGPRTTYNEFKLSGSLLARTSTRPWGGYVYARDTNQVCNEVAMALYVRDMRHSTLRICYDPNLI